AIKEENTPPLPTYMEEEAIEWGEEEEALKDTFKSILWSSGVLQEYAYLGANETLPMIISANINSPLVEALIAVLRKHTQAIGYSIVDIVGIPL
ncbi:hypothetical protein HAX54_002882, partial [Datura stramonium]|nr:hypothetical protein [Datura stramonium]